MKTIYPSFATPVELLASLDLNRWKKSLKQRFEELGVPGNKTEQYKNFSIKPLLNRTYAYEEPQQHKVIDKKNVLTISDGVLTSKPEGLDIMFDVQEDIDMEHFDALYYLGHLLSPRLIVIHVSCDMDLTIKHLFNQEETLLAYRVVLKVATDCHVNVFETFETHNSKGSLLLYGLDIQLTEYATLTWIRHQVLKADDATIIGSHRYDVHSKAELTLQTFDFGEGNSLHLYKNDLADHTDTKVSHLIFATKSAHRGNVLQLRHNGVYANSVHLAKSILKDRATGIFDGLIRVDKKAPHASAFQNSKAVLLNNGAFMKAKPQLEIYTDELEASHGATTGQLDEAALFYLSSRGISTEEARKMLILAFAHEMIEDIKDKKVAQQIKHDFESAYYTDVQKELS